MPRSSSWAVLALCLAAAVPAGTAAAAPRAAAPPTNLQPVLGCGLSDGGDKSQSSVSFAGLPAANDVVVGAPGAERGGRSRAGTVEVRYACDAVEGTQELQLPTPHTGDRFGAAVTVAHLNGDVYDDLVVGVPGLDVGKADDAGGIATFLGSPQGLVYNQTLTQSSAGVPGSAQAGAHFGAVLDFDADSWWDSDGFDGRIGVGAPDKDVHGVKDAGAVVIMTTLLNVRPEVRLERTLDSPGVPGKPGRGDHLGAAIDLGRGAYGLPGRKVDGHARAGAVLTGRRDDGQGFELVTQDTKGFAGAAEKGDAFGSSLAGGWIGVPGEDLDGRTDAGLVQSLRDGDAVSLATDGFPGSPQRGDRLGASLAVWVPLGYAPTSVRVLAGMPGRKVAGVTGAGALLAFKHIASGSPRISFPSVAGMPDPQKDAHFGTAATRASNQVVVGAPGADSGRGRAAVYDTENPQNPLALQGQWTQAAGAGRKNGYGTALGGIPRG
ncbi:hypothetical protein GCM10022197_23880 [Microlunatus spumicola]|uniref:Esterase n=1 Tax=Microlunatus spumicola TaxID=81499 RepID=A0ABP6XIP5_9ACTN